MLDGTRRRFADTRQRARRKKMVIQLYLRAVLAGILAACWGGPLLMASSPQDTRPANSWNPKAAAAYLDQRESWWRAWPLAARSEGTFCISCHTVAPYAFTRPLLRRAIGEETASPNERSLLASVAMRVRHFSNLEPFYTDESYGAGKALESRGTEAVLNALILAGADAWNGKISDDSRAAFDEMWALQETKGDAKGAWPWLNFGNEPFEASDSSFYGAALAAVAAGIAPEGYSATPRIQENLRQLREYLNRQCLRQSLINRVALLWADTRLPGLLTVELRESIIRESLSAQRTDGGWGLASLSWNRKTTSLSSLFNLWIRSDGTPLNARSDGYATGLIVFVLEQAGLACENRHLQRGLAWLVRNQDQTKGSWPGYSLNRHHDSGSATGRFMTDAATAYAVLALLTRCRTRGTP